MKKILCCFLCLVCGLSQAEESRRAEHLRKVMTSKDWETRDVTFEEIGRQGQLMLIKRSGDVVGYYYAESVWEPGDVETGDLGEVTRIVFGYDLPGLATLFLIDDRAEIAVWVAAYRNHTEFERRFACFIPTEKSAGFGRVREEYQFGGGCMCSIALRFYAGEKEVLELKGHLQDHPEFDSGTRNFILHELAKAKLPEKVTNVARDADAANFDPFSEVPDAEEAKTEQ